MTKTRRVHFLAYKMYSYDTETFLEDALNYSQDSIILVFDFEKVAVYHKPNDIELRPTTLRYFSFRKKTLNRLFMPLVFLFTLLRIYIFLFRIFLRARPQTAWIENTHVAFWVGLMKKLKLCNRMIYLPGDWIATARNQKFLSRLGNNFLFPLLDYGACRLSDRVLNHAQEIADARAKYWGRPVASKESLYVSRFKIKAAATPPGELKSICFLGNMREDSGLDIAIRSLKELRLSENFLLKIIGPQRQDYPRYLELAQRCGVADHVRFFGFVRTEEIPAIFADGFCALNVITNQNSYTSFTIPGKTIHYLQLLLPIIASVGIGPMAGIIQRHRLGLVIEPSQKKFMESVVEIYKKKDEFRQNIRNYIESQKKVALRDMIEN